MYTDMEWWEEIRQRVRNQGVSKREILRETGMHWTTLEKILEHPEPPGYRMKRPRPKPKLGPYLGRIRQIIEEDKGLPEKQRHTAKRIFERIPEEGYSGGYTQVKEAVREIRRHSQEVFVPLVHREASSIPPRGRAVRCRGGAGEAEGCTGQGLLLRDVAAVFGGAVGSGV